MAVAFPTVRCVCVYGMVAPETLTTKAGGSFRIEDSGLLDSAHVEVFACGPCPFSVLVLSRESCVMAEKHKRSRPLVTFVVYILQEEEGVDLAGAVNVLSLLRHRLLSL